MNDTANEFDEVNKAKHYNQHPIFSLECIDYVKDMNFLTGNALKYLYRYKDKANPPQDIRKAIYYCNAWLNENPKDNLCTNSPRKDVLDSMNEDFRKWAFEKKEHDNSRELTIALTIISLYEGSKKKVGDVISQLEHIAQHLEESND